MSKHYWLLLTFGKLAYTIYYHRKFTQRHSKQAMQHAQNEPEKSVLPYQQLVKFSQLFQSQSSTDNELAQEIHRRTVTLYNELTAVLSR